MGHGTFWNRDDKSWDAEVIGLDSGKNYSPKKVSGVITPDPAKAPTALSAGKDYKQSAQGYNAGYNAGAAQYAGAGYQTYNNTNYKKCPGHDGLTIVYAYEDGATLCGASRYDLMKHGVDLLIDCGVDVSNNSFVKSCPTGFEDLKIHGIVPNMLRLDWPDRAAPAVGWEFWRALREKFQPGWNIVACCIGGHGRTGTCLAALLIEDGMGAKEAIEQVRTIHCTYAVESDAQEMYLEWLASVMPRREGVKG